MSNSRPVGQIEPTIAISVLSEPKRAIEIELQGNSCVFNYCFIIQIKSVFFGYGQVT